MKTIKILLCASLALAGIACSGSDDGKDKGQSGQTPNSGSGNTVIETSVPTAPLPARVYATRITVAQPGKAYVTDAKAGLLLTFKGGAFSVLRAELDRPLGVATDGEHIFVGEAGKGQVRILDMTGLTTGFLGAGEGEFKMPNSIAAKDGVVYVADSRANAVKAYQADGTPLFSFGSHGSRDGELAFPAAVAVSPMDGSVVVGDQGNHRLSVFTADGNFSRTIGKETDSKAVGKGFEGTFARVQDVAVDAEGDILVLDSYQGNIQQFSAAGAFQGFVAQSGMRLPLGMAVGPDGDLLVANSGLYSVMTVENAGARTSSARYRRGE